MEERREAARVEVDTAIYIFWGETEGGLNSGKITSLSSKGCFVQTKAEAYANQTIFIRMRLPTERWMLLRGEVIHALNKVGFGMRFTGSSTEDNSMLALLVEYYREDPTVVVGVICEKDKSALKARRVNLEPVRR